MLNKVKSRLTGKKSFSRFFVFLFPCFLVSLFLTGCFEDEITFKGKVLQASVAYIKDNAGEIVATGYTVDGPLPNAIVRCVGYSETAITDANGLYDLDIEVTRVIGFKAKADSYILQAFSQRTYNNPNLYFGTDETISQYVDARPGDTIHVRDFVLMYHTREEGVDSGLQ